MAPLPGLRKQDPHQADISDGAAKLPPVLPQMQSGDAHQCGKISYIRYQRAGRLDAEPITSEMKVSRSSALFFRFLCMHMPLKSACQAAGKVREEPLE